MASPEVLKAGLTSAGLTSPAQIWQNNMGQSEGQRVFKNRSPQPSEIVCRMHLQAVRYGPDTETRSHITPYVRH